MTVRPAGGLPAYGGGFQALATVARSFGVSATATHLAHEMSNQPSTVPSAEVLVRSAVTTLRLKARVVRHPTPRRLCTIPTPALMMLKNGTWGVWGGDTVDGKFRIYDPINRRNERMTMDEVLLRMEGTVVLVGRPLEMTAERVAFSLSWFLPAIRRYRRPMVLILLLSLLVNVLALGMPLTFQLIVDKVLPYNSYNTLLVVILGMALLSVFSAVTKYLRAYLLQHTSNRLDVELGSKLYAHLLHLPVSYFETRAAGITVTRARELRTIRAFLTGEALTSIIDLAFIVIYLGVLFLYSSSLALVVSLTLPGYILVGGFIRPALKRKIKQKFRRWAAGQQLLVESLIGIQTLKAAAVEPQFQRKWQDRLASFVRVSFEATMLGVLATNMVTLLSNITIALVLFFGTLEALDQKMTIGGLIAFSMITRLLTRPILRTSQLWQDFQEFLVAIDHIADIFNYPVEQIPDAAVAPGRIRGDVELRDVIFRYRPDLPLALNGISLSIRAGERIGIVGPSGSGKSTVAKLLQRLHSPTSGEILVNGVDLEQVDPAWLRRQLGVVLQENFLFNQTVHDNIAMARPGMSRAEVIRVARLAGADEFIAQLVQGYDTVIEERGANLSGGQRQRIAIARALATDPRILIFDEATSALDYESERIIQENMEQIAQDRTVIIVAHRLAAVRHCDRIVGMTNGRIVEVGNHQELLRRRQGLYSYLWALQNEHLTT
jgi:ATP-binding cassette, subfamily B, bacterial HlyB/CyaB